MAAADYYMASAVQTAPHASPHQQSPYQQSPQQRPHELHGSPVPQHNLPPSSNNAYPPPPPYQPNYQQSYQDEKPSVHFVTPSSQPQKPSSGPSSSRPSFSHYGSSPNQGSYLQAPPHHSPYAQHAAPHRPSQAAMQPPHMRPYMNGNQSQYSLGSGYSSDPEPGRRRRHRRHERKDDQELSRDTKPRHHRSRSTNADSFLGAAGGGLIGDLIFPGLGTVGGAVVGWLGGRDYGKHRKSKEEKLHHEQKEWEHKFRDRSNSDENRHHHEHHSDHRHDLRHHKPDY